MTSLKDIGLTAVELIKELKDNTLVVAHSGTIDGILRELFNIREVYKTTIEKTRNCHISVIKFNKKYELVLSCNNKHLVNI